MGIKTWIQTSQVSYAELGAAARKIGKKLENDFLFSFLFPLRGQQTVAQGSPTPPGGQLGLGEGEVEDDEDLCQRENVLHLYCARPGKGGRVRGG